MENSFDEAEKLAELLLKKDALGRTFFVEYIKYNLPKAEKYFETYLLEHKEKIAEQLKLTGEYTIKSPYGLVAHITTKEKRQDAKQS